MTARQSVINGAMQPELTPATITLPRSQTPVEVILEKQGFRAVRTRLAPVADQSFPYQLRPLPSAAQRLTLPTRPGAEEGKGTLSPRPRSSGSKRAASRDGGKDPNTQPSAPEDPKKVEAPAPQSRSFKPMPDF